MTRSNTSPGETPAEREPVPLSTLCGGARAMVCGRQVDAAEGELLSAMGLTDRCLLRVCRVGEPCIIEIATMRLGLSAAMARRILVRPVDERV